MRGKITFEFDSIEEMTAIYTAVTGARAAAASTAEPETETTDESDTADEPVRRKRGRPAKVETAAVSASVPGPEKTKKAALADVVSAIRSFVLADKATNMLKLIPLMPAGVKSLDALDLEQAQRVALGLGLDVA